MNTCNNMSKLCVCLCVRMPLATMKLFILVIGLLQELRTTIYEQLNSQKITSALKNKYASSLMFIA